MTNKIRAQRENQIPQCLFDLEKQRNGDGMAHIMHEYTEGEFEIEEMYCRIISYLMGADWPVKEATKKN